MEDNHERLASSGAGQWAYCPGSIKAQENLPKQEETEDSKEGTASHWVATTVLESYKAGDAYGMVQHALTTFQLIGQTAPNGIIITEEMAEGASEFVLSVLCVAQKFGLLQSMHVEEKVMVPRVHPNNGGTPDAWIFDKERLTLYVFDYKYGHRFVEVFENWQMIDYGIGILDEITGGNGIADQHITVVFVIVQPRYYRAEIERTWTVNASDLRPYANQLEDAAHNALSDNPRIQTGPHCRDCTARYLCEGAQQAAAAGMEYTGTLTGMLNLLPPEALGVELRALERAIDAIEFRYEALKEQALVLSKLGKDIQGWRPKEKYGRLKWVKPFQEIVALGQMFGVDLVKSNDPKLCTPNQAVKLGIDESVIKAYSETPNKGLELVKDDDSLAKRVFTQQRWTEK